MHCTFIMQQWRWRKIESTDAQDELLLTREARAKSCIDYITWWEGRHRSSLDEEASVQLLQDMETSLSAFNGHPLIDEWLLQYQPTAHGVRFRFKTLLLLGGSEQGKSQKAMSLFGQQHTLVVSCQGLGSAVPSLRQFQSGVHKAILFDEGNERQVLENKVLFQAGPQMVALSQSVCNQHRYTVYVYQVAMIICSNKFQMMSDEHLTAEDSEWLRKNIVVVQLPSTQKWYRANEDNDEVANSYGSKCNSHGSASTVLVNYGWSSATKKTSQVCSLARQVNTLWCRQFELVAILHVMCLLFSVLVLVSTFHGCLPTRLKWASRTLV